MEKYYFTYDQIHSTIKNLSMAILDSGFSPDVIVAIGSGGFIPARILRTFLGKPILTVGIAYYDIDNKPTSSPRKIQWIDEIEQKLKNKRILLVDEVDDTRVTLEYCLGELMRHNPAELAVAVLHNKDKKKKGTLPEGVRLYFAGMTLEDRWICYPWDAEDIAEHRRLAEGK